MTDLEREGLALLIEATAIDPALRHNAPRLEAAVEWIRRQLAIDKRRRGKSNCVGGEPRGSADPIARRF